MVGNSNVCKRGKWHSCVGREHDRFFSLHMSIPSPMYLEAAKPQGGCEVGALVKRTVLGKIGRTVGGTTVTTVTAVLGRMNKNVMDHGSDVEQFWTIRPAAGEWGGSMIRCSEKGSVENAWPYEGDFLEFFFLSCTTCIEMN